MTPDEARVRELRAEEDASNAAHHAEMKAELIAFAVSKVREVLSAHPVLTGTQVLEHLAEEAREARTARDNAKQHYSEITTRKHRNA